MDYCWLKYKRDHSPTRMIAVNAPGDIQTNNKPISWLSGIYDKTKWAAVWIKNVDSALVEPVIGDYFAYRQSNDNKVAGYKYIDVNSKGRELINNNVNKVQYAASINGGLFGGLLKSICLPIGSVGVNHDWVCGMPYPSGRWAFGYSSAYSYNFTTNKWD